jgi:hypothetical protein
MKALINTVGELVHIYAYITMGPFICSFHYHLSTVVAGA